MCLTLLFRVDAASTLDAAKLQFSVPNFKYKGRCSDNNVESEEMKVRIT